MKTPSCDDFELLMPDALTGRLAAADALALEAHLAECAACRGSYEECSRAAAALEGSFPASGQQTALLWARVAQSVQAQPAAAGPFAPRRVWWSAAAMVAAAAFVFLLARLALPTPLPKSSSVERGSGTPPAPRALLPDSDRVFPAEGPAQQLPPPAQKVLTDLPAPETGRKSETAAAPGELTVNRTPSLEARPPLPAPRPTLHDPRPTLPDAPLAVAPRVERAEAVSPARPARENIDDTLGLAVTRLAGPLAVFDPQYRAWRSVVAGERVPYGWQVRTGAGGRAELAFGESRIRLDENTALTIERDAGRKRVANLSSGRLRVDLLRADAGFQIRSGGGVVELRGTIVEVDAPAANVAFVRVLEGHADVAAKVAQAAEPIKVSAAAGQETLLACTAAEQALRLLPEAVRARALALAKQAGVALPFEKRAAWDEELDRPRPKSAAAVGQLIVKDQQGREAEPLAIEQMDVRVSIRGPEALTRIVQVFLNQTGRTLEGTFYFPLPPGAAISRYAMYVDDKTLIEGEVVERGRARAIYESILHAKRDPALLEWMEGNLFKTRIFPIAPYGRKQLILEYTELLPAFFDTRRYVLPLVSELTQKTGIQRLGIHVDLEAGDSSKLSAVFSPSYPKETLVAGTGSPHATAELSLANCRPAADFVLSFSVPRPSELFCSAYGEAGEQPYLLFGYQLRPAPERLSGATPCPRDVLFMVETSGARTPQDLDAQARVLQAMAAGLSLEDDRVAVAAADVAFVPCVQGFLPAHGDEAGAALKAVAQRAPLGALDLGAALRGATEFMDSHAGPGRQRVAVFIGAGMPAYGELDAGCLAKDGAAQLARAKTMFIGVGVGRAVDALVLSELARRAGGFYRPLRVDEGLDEAAFLLALGLQTPLLAAPEFEHRGALCDVYPESLGALLPGQEVFFHARAKQPLPEELGVKGRLAGEEYARQFAPAWLADLRADPAVGRFWARAKLDGLLAQPQTDELRRQVIDLAQTWTLMSPYTSFLVLESEADYQRYGIDRRKRRALSLIAGLSADASKSRLGQTDREQAASLAAEQSRNQRLLLERKISIMVDQGKALFETGKYDAAVSLAHKILELDPTNAEAHSIIATARDRYNAERKKQIEEEYKESFTLSRERAERKSGKEQSHGDATQAEIEQLKKDIEQLHRQLQGSSAAMPRSSVEQPLTAKYGPGANVMTKSGKLTTGGLLQAWFYGYQQDNRDVGAGSNGGAVVDTNGASDDSSFRIRRAQLKFTMDIHENTDSVVPIDPAREATSFPRPKEKPIVIADGSGPALTINGGSPSHRAWGLDRWGSIKVLDDQVQVDGTNPVTGRIPRVYNYALSTTDFPGPHIDTPTSRGDFKSSWEVVEEASINYGRQLIYPQDWDQISRRAETATNDTGLFKSPAYTAGINYYIKGHNDLEQPGKQDIGDKREAGRETEQFKARMAPLLDQVRELYDKTRYQDAERLALRVLQIDPLNGDAEAWKQKARAAYHSAELAAPAGTQGETIAVDLTREQVAQLLALNPLKPGSESLRAELLRKLARLTDGAAGYRVLADGMTGFGGAGPQAEALARDLLGRVGRETDAKALDEALGMVKDSGLRGLVLARRAALTSDLAERASFLERAYAESEQDPAYLRPLCESLRAAGKSKLLLERIEAALRQGVSQPWMWQSLSEACAAGGDQTGALRGLTQAVALRPREAEPRRQLALALKRSGRAAEAVAQLRAACEFSPDNIALHRELLALASSPLTLPSPPGGEGRVRGDSGAREWVLLAMLGRDWQPADGDVVNEANREFKALISEHERAGNAEYARQLERRLAVANAMDVVIVMSWDTDGTDVDLHVAEPHAKVNYQAKRSFQGGTLDRDVTTGYGPETYSLRHGAPGEYVVKVQYYSGGKLTTAKVKATFKKGSRDERTETRSVELKRAKEEVEVFRFKL